MKAGQYVIHVGARRAAKVVGVTKSNKHYYTSLQWLDDGKVSNGIHISELTPVPSLYRDANYLKLHTADCLRLFRKWEADVQIYITEWPDHCQSCKGHGGTSFAGSRHEPPSFEPCDACLPKCPRCGRGTFDIDNCELDTECPSCGWQWDQKVGDSVPDWECWGCREA